MRGQTTRVATFLMTAAPQAGSLELGLVLLDLHRLQHLHRQPAQERQVLTHAGPGDAVGPRHPGGRPLPLQGRLEVHGAHHGARQFATCPGWGATPDGRFGDEAPAFDLAELTCKVQ